MHWEGWKYPWPAAPTPEPELDRDRMVTLSIGQLTDAIAEALKVVKDVPAEPRWKVGNRAFVEVEVRGHHGPNKEHVNVVVVGKPEKSGIALPASLLQEIA